MNEDFKKHLGEAPSKTQTISVKVRRLDTILNTHAPDIAGIDILAIDVKGWELHVLRGLDFSLHRPTVVILENVFQDLAYEDAMIARGYERCKWLYPNEVYIKRTPGLMANRIARRLARRPKQMAKIVLGPLLARYREFKNARRAQS